MVKSRTTDFLITFDHDARKQISLEEFHNTLQALRAYSEREEQYRNNSRVEVVLLGADSIEAIKVTHSNYFEDTAKTGDTFKTFIHLVGRWCAQRWLSDTKEHIHRSSPLEM